MVAAKSALMTGASRGSGRGIATRLAERGYALTITGRYCDQLQTVAHELISDGAQHAQGVVADMASEEDVVTVLEKHEKAFGELAVLIVVPSVGSAGPTAGFPLARHEEQFAFDTRAAFVTICHALPLLRSSASADRARGAPCIALARHPAACSDRKSV